MWSPHQPQQTLRTCWKHRFLGPTPNLLHPEALGWSPQNLYLTVRVILRPLHRENHRALRATCPHNVEQRGWVSRAKCHGKKSDKREHCERVHSHKGLKQAKLVLAVRSQTLPLGAGEETAESFRGLGDVLLLGLGVVTEVNVQPVYLEYGHFLYSTALRFLKRKNLTR